MSIVLKDLSKRYGNLVVVNRVSLEVRDGELFVLLGGSGSGKSTILRMIAGLTEPDGGSIHLRGREVTHLPPQERDTGFVFQNYSIFRHLTVAENIEFGLKLRQVPPQERRRRCEELLDLVELAGLGQRTSRQLSGGQQQRVALARALAYNPTVLLLDEPFGALDAKIRLQLRRGLREIQQRLKVTTILVTHDQDEAFELGDRIGLLDRGHLVEVGRPEDLYHRPVSQFAATFVGGGNLLVGRLRQGCVELGTASVPLKEPPPAFLDGAPARVLIRSENLALGTEPFSDLVNLGEGEVTQRSFAGAVERVRVRLESLQGVRVVAPTPVFGDSGITLEASLAGVTGWVAGQKVWVGVRDFHLIARIGLKSLVVMDPFGSEEAVDFGCRLAQQAGAPATLFTVGPAEVVERLRQSWEGRLPNLKVLWGQGDLEQGAVQELQDRAHELAVVGGPPFEVGASLLQLGVAPVLFVRRSRPSLSRLLICTAGGESGKAAVWMGGRIARRTGASATVVHIHAPTHPVARQRALRHLEQARFSLEAMNVSTQPVFREGTDPLGFIQELLAADSYDLVVCGAPGFDTAGRLDRTSLVGRLLEVLEIPVLVVPLAPTFRKT